MFDVEHLRCHSMFDIKYRMGLCCHSMFDIKHRMGLSAHFRDFGDADLRACIAEKETKQTACHNSTHRRDYVFALASGEDSTVLSPERSISPQQGHLDLEKGEK